MVLRDAFVELSRMREFVGDELSRGAHPSGIASQLQGRGLASDQANRLVADVMELRRLQAAANAVDTHAGRIGKGVASLVFAGGMALLPLVPAFGREAAHVQWLFFSAMIALAGFAQIAWGFCRNSRR